MYDLVIRDALLLDGLGSAPARGDLAVTEGASLPSGKVDGAARKTTLDADGLALMPGIIDNHTHYDAQITWDPVRVALARARRDHRGDRQLRLHHRALPRRDRELVMRNLTQVEGMSLEVAARRHPLGLRDACRSTSTCSSASGAAVNIAAFVGHSACAPT